jgi:twitching motility protein PilI
MARRISLREFQQGLVERLTSAQRGETPRALLGIQAGPDHWLLELADSGEIVPLPHITQVPLTQPWFRGLANIRGTLYTVVDFSAFQGTEATPLNSEARLVLANSRFGFLSALLVNKALGLRSLDSLDPRPGTPAARKWEGEQYADSQGRVWKKLLIRELFSDPGFLEIGA